MYANKNGKVVNENDQYIGLDEKQYASSYPKEKIRELTLVIETATPTDENLKVTGFTVNSSYVQVWTTEEKTNSEKYSELRHEKENKKQELKDFFNKERTADIFFNGNIFQADEASFDALKEKMLVYLTATPEGFYWRAKDNINVPFSRSDLEGLVMAIGDRSNNLFLNFQSKNELAKTKTSLALVKSVSW